MSYDIWLVIDTGAPEDDWPEVVEIGNYPDGTRGPPSSGGG